VHGDEEVRGDELVQLEVVHMAACADLRRMHDSKDMVWIHMESGHVVTVPALGDRHRVKVKLILKIAWAVSLHSGMSSQRNPSARVRRAGSSASSRSVAPVESIQRSFMASSLQPFSTRPLATGVGRMGWMLIMPLPHSSSMPRTPLLRCRGASSARLSSTWGAACTPACTSPGILAPTRAAFGQDVLALTREIGPTVVRYPGGNFVSSYRWEDGIGPTVERPARLDLAWHSIETNQFGLHEFVSWADRVGTEIMLAVNLGTRGLQEACDLVEYTNHPGGTYWSDRRIANGAPGPFRHQNVVPRQRNGRPVAGRTEDRVRVRPTSQ
jgi:hypothetical protein